jgi:hypothetical protein
MITMKWGPWSDLHRRIRVYETRPLFCAVGALFGVLELGVMDPVFLRRALDRAPSPMPDSTRSKRCWAGGSGAIGVFSGLTVGPVGPVQPGKPHEPPDMEKTLPKVHLLPAEGAKLRDP